MKGLNLSEVAHFVPIIMPQDITGGETGIEFNMALYAHASIFINLGVSASAQPRSSSMNAQMQTATMR